MRLLFATLVLTAFSSGFAAAESFTFTVAFEPAEHKSVTVGTHYAFFSATKGKFVQKWASGDRTTGDVVCTAWSTETGAAFDSRGICETTDSNGGNAGYIYNCNFLNDTKTETVCWGQQSGRGGKFDGRMGTVTWGQKDNKASGGGLWKD